MDTVKIEAVIADTDEVARELWMKPVAKDGEEAKLEDRYPKSASGIRPPIFTDDQGRPVTPWDFDARKRGIVVQTFEGVDVEPDPKSTFEKPLPPILVRPYVKIAIVGRTEAKAALEAKLAAARAVDVAKAALVKTEPVEGEVVRR